MGRIVTGRLDLKPTARSYAPAPDRPVSQPSIKSRAVVVRTDPQFKARDERFVPIINPQNAARQRQDQPARDVNGSTGNTSQRTQTNSDRNAQPARVYQAPQYRPPANAQQNSQSTGQQGRNNQAATTRTDSNVRTQQSPPPAQTHRADSPPPAARNSDTGRVQSSPPPRTMDRPPSMPPPASPPPRPPASSPPPPSSPPSNPPTKKDPEPGPASSFVSRQYEAPEQSSYQAAAYGSSATSTPASPGRSSALRYSQPVSDGANRLQVGEPRMAAPQYTAQRQAAQYGATSPQSSVAHTLSTAPRSAMISSATNGGARATTRRR